MLYFCVKIAHINEFMLFIECGMLETIRVACGQKILPTPELSLLIVCLHLYALYSWRDVVWLHFICVNFHVHVDTII